MASSSGPPPSAGCPLPVPSSAEAAHPGPGPPRAQAGEAAPPISPVECGPLPHVAARPPGSDPPVGGPCTWCVPAARGKRSQIIHAPHPPLRGTKLARKLGQSTRSRTPTLSPPPQPSGSSLSQIGEFLTRRTAHYPAELTWQLLGLLVVSARTGTTKPARTTTAKSCSAAPRPVSLPSQHHPRLPPNQNRSRRHMHRHPSDQPLGQRCSPKAFRLGVHRVARYRPHLPRHPSVSS